MTVRFFGQVIAYILNLTLTLILILLNENIDHRIELYESLSALILWPNTLLPLMYDLIFWMFTEGIDIAPFSTLLSKSLSTFLGIILVPIYLGSALISIHYYLSIAGPISNILIFTGVLIILQFIFLIGIANIFVLTPMGFLIFMSSYLQVAAMMAGGYLTATISFSLLMLTLVGGVIASILLTVISGLSIFIAGIIIFAPVILMIDLLLLPLVITYFIFNFS